MGHELLGIMPLQRSPLSIPVRQMIDVIPSHENDMNRHRSNKFGSCRRNGVDGKFKIQEPAATTTE